MFGNNSEILVPLPPAIIIVSMLLIITSDVTFRNYICVNDLVLVPNVNTVIENHIIHLLLNTCQFIAILRKKLIQFSLLRATSYTQS